MGGWGGGAGRRSGDRREKGTAESVDGASEEGVGVRGGGGGGVAEGEGCWSRPEMVRPRNARKEQQRQ